MSYYGGGGGGYPGQGYQGSQSHEGYGGGGGGGGYHPPPPGPPPDHGYGGHQGYGGGGYRPQEDQGYSGGYRPQQDQGYGGGGGYHPPPPGPPPRDDGYGGHQSHHQQQGYGQQGGHYPPPTGPRPEGYGGEREGGYQQSHKPRPPQHAPPPGLDAYGYPLPAAPYAAHEARAGPPPPSGPQQFGHGAPDNYTFQYSDCTGKRKALLIGINYLGQEGELRGCINDVHNLSAFLVERHNYKREDMVLLTDDQDNPVMRPTKANIQRAMGWLVNGAQPNDSLFLHYSGHGGQTEDLDGDEDDGYDEVIYPVDHTTEGHIVDDEIHAMVVKPLAAGVRLTAIFDSCHSATVMDLPYVYSTKGVLKEPNLAKEAGEGALAALSAYASGDMGGVASSVFKFAKTAYKGDSAYEKTKDTRTSPADIIMWSGSKDDQTSADATIANKATGAMSYAFITALKANSKQSYVELLNSIRDVLAEKYDQKPQLSCSHPLDTDLLFVM